MNFDQLVVLKYGTDAHTVVSLNGIFAVSFFVHLFHQHSM